MDNSNLTFEAAMNRLQEISNTIQKPDCSLDEGIKLYEEALQLSKFCNEKLKGFQEKLALLDEGENE